MTYGREHSGTAITALLFSTLLTLNLSLKLSRYAIGILCQISSTLRPNVDCPLVRYGPLISNGQQRLEALQVRKVTFALGIVERLTLYQSN